MADPARAQRLADRIKEIVAETLEQRVKDPRLGFVTVTDARLTGDLREATVFYTAYGDDEARAASAAALASVTGLLRSEVGRRTGIRYAPTVALVADVVPETARQIDDLLRTARASDAAVAEAAAGATYAGEADPYKHPADDEAVEGTDDSADAAADGGSDDRGGDAAR